VRVTLFWIGHADDATAALDVAFNEDRSWCAKDDVTSLEALNGLAWPNVDPSELCLVVV
jgi:hypothetical protein